MYRESMTVPSTGNLFFFFFFLHHWWVVCRGQMTSLSKRKAHQRFTMETDGIFRVYYHVYYYHQRPRSKVLPLFFPTFFLYGTSKHVVKHVVYKNSPDYYIRYRLLSREREITFINFVLNKIRLLEFEKRSK